MDNQIIVPPFRSVTRAEMEPSSSRFQVHVIGYRMTFEHLVNVPAGVACTFIHIFHDPVPLMDQGEITLVPAHTMYIYKPHKPLYHGYAGKRYTHSWLRCSGQIVSPTLAECCIPYNTPLHFDSSRANEESLMAIHHEQQHARGADPSNLEDLFCVWMRSIRRELGTQAEPIPQSFLKAKQLIETRYLEAPRLGDIGREVGLSTSHLCKGFRKYFSLSPINYSISLRLQHAMELFACADMNISQIAEASGFPDVYYFSRMFKKHVGRNPSDYRRNSK